MGHVYISAAHKSSGKTTLSIGLCAALARRGLAVQPFKRGPDYIDPLWLGRAAGRPCHNLDFNVQTPAEIRRVFGRFAQSADISLVEGNKGLHDGLDPEGTDSNAALARLLGAPVILVLDTRGTLRGVAPLLLGYQAFDPAVRIAGVILNQVGGARHESKLRAAVERYTDIPVLGVLMADPDLRIPERHLGLMPSNEAPEAGAHIERLADRTAASVDLDRLIDVAATAPMPAVARPEARPTTADLRIAVARDAAFGFYYPGDLDALRAGGADLAFFDATRDRRLPDADGLFIGGGFPETQAAALSANAALRHDIRDAIEAGLPAYAECGGLMYLSRAIVWNGARHEMCGVIPGDSVMCGRPQGRGYIRLRETTAAPWPADDDAAAAFAAHEFHYSRLENVTEPLTFAWEVLRGHGVDGRHDGIVYKNLLAGYGHLRHVVDNPWTARFLRFVRRWRDLGRGRPRAAGVSA